MSKFSLNTFAIGETRYFEPVALGYASLQHLRRNLGATIFMFHKRNPGVVLSSMIVGDRLMVRRWK